MLVLLLITAGAPPQLDAQTRSIRFERLTVEDGLSQSTINDFLQDRTGFLWIATQDGLNRYDGYGFEVFEHDPEDPASLPGNWIEELAEDASGDLWIATEGAGLARWRRATGSFVRMRHDPQDPASLSGDRVVSIHVDREGSIWLGTAESGLNRMDPQTGRCERFQHDPAAPSSLSGNYVQTLHEDRRGDLWVGTFSGLDRFEASTRTFVHFRHDPADVASLSDNRVLSILEDHGGTLWVGTMDGLNRWDPETRGFVRYVHDPADPDSISQNRVRVLFEDRSQRLWMATDGGLNLLLDVSGRFAHYRHRTADPHSLSNDRVMSIYQDRGGVLWVGTQGSGINKWNPATWAFSHFKADPSATEGLTSNAVHGFAEDAERKIWIATHGGVSVLDRSAGRFRHYRHDPEDPTSLSDDRVAAVLHGRQGTLWVATLAGGLNRLDAGARGFRRYRHDPTRPESLAGDAVSSLFEDREGVLWVGTWGAGLDRFGGTTPDHGNDIFVHFRHDPENPASLSADRVTALAATDGYLWIGTFGGGLNRMDRSQGGFLRLRHEPGRPSSLSNDTVYDLHLDDSGVVWVGTQRGFNRLQSLAAGKASFRRYLERDGLPNDTVWGIEPGTAGRLWLATNDGLARFDPETESFRSFTTNHGLQSDEFNFGAHFRSSSGELFFGGVNGFNAFFPHHIEPNPHVPPVVLTSFTKINQPVDFGRPISDVERVELSYRDYFFSLEFAALDFTAPDENRYRYRLEGFDADWVDLGPRRRLTFTNLDPGNYTLRVQGANNDGVWNEAGLAIRLAVQPPFWQTWWFRSAGLLAFTGALWTVHHRQLAKAARRQQELAEANRAAERERLIAQLEAKNTELERFTSTVSHDLKAPLLTIKGFLGFVRDDAAAQDSERLELDIERIESATDKMSALVEDLLHLSRVGQQVNPPMEVPFGELAQEALELVAGQVAERRVEVRIDPALPVVVGDRARLVAALQNLLQNAVKYMGDQGHPRVEIGARREDVEQVFYVRDNGMGIEAKDSEKIFEPFQRLGVHVDGTGIGLALVQRIVELHGGRIWVESDGRGQGSTFCFTLGEITPPAPGQPA